MPYPYQIATGKLALRPRQRPGPYYYESGDRLFVVLRDATSREIEVHYSDDDGATWAEADGTNRPMQTSATDGQEGALQNGAMVRRVGDVLKIAYVPDGSTEIAIKDFDLPTAAWGTAITGGPEPSFGWEFFLDGSDIHIYYNKLGTFGGQPCYQIFRERYLSGAWEGAGSALEVTDPESEDEIQSFTPSFLTPLSTNILNLSVAESGTVVLWYAVNNNTLNASTHPWLRVRLIDGSTISQPILCRFPIPNAGVDTEGYYNGAAEIVTCGSLEIAILPILLSTIPITLNDHSGGAGDYFDNGLAMLYLDGVTPHGLRMDAAGPLTLETRAIGGDWPGAPSVLWDEATHTLRYYYSRVFEVDHPDEGECDIMVAQSKMGAWEEPATVFATTPSLATPPPTGYYLNTIAFKSAAFVKAGDVGFVFQCSPDGTVTNNTYENPHYFQHTPSACTMTSACGGGANSYYGLT